MKTGTCSGAFANIVIGKPPLIRYVKHEPPKLNPVIKMKTSRALTILILLASLPLCAFAAEKKKKKAVVPSGPPKVDQAAVAVLKPYDKDGDFDISRDELAAIQTEYKSNPKGPLKDFDLDHNGVLDDVVDRASMNMKLGQLKMSKQAPAKPAPKKKK